MLVCSVSDGEFPDVTFLLFHVLVPIISTHRLSKPCSVSASSFVQLHVSDVCSKLACVTWSSSPLVPVRALRTLFLPCLMDLSKSTSPIVIPRKLTVLRPPTCSRSRAIDSVGCDALSTIALLGRDPIKGLLQIQLGCVQLHVVPPLVSGGSRDPHSYSNLSRNPSLLEPVGAHPPAVSKQLVERQV